MNCPNCNSPISLDVSFTYTTNLKAEGDVFDLEKAVTQMRDEIAEHADWSLELVTDIEGYCDDCGDYFDVELDEANWPRVDLLESYVQQKGLRFAIMEENV